MTGDEKSVSHQNQKQKESRLGLEQFSVSQTKQKFIESERKLLRVCWDSKKIL